MVASRFWGRGGICPAIELQEVYCMALKVAMGLLPYPALRHHHNGPRWNGDFITFSAIGFALKLACDDAVFIYS
jgi:hypothetical protein